MPSIGVLSFHGASCCKITKSALTDKLHSSIFIVFYILVFIFRGCKVTIFFESAQKGVNILNIRLTAVPPGAFSNK